MAAAATMMATGEDGVGPANNGPGCGYPRVRLLLLSLVTAAVLLLAMAAAGVSPLNFAATACTADHISLIYLGFFRATLKKSNHLLQTFSSIHFTLFFCKRQIRPQLALNLARSSGAPANSVVLH